MVVLRSAIWVMIAVFDVVCLRLLLQGPPNAVGFYLLLILGSLVLGKAIDLLTKLSPGGKDLFAKAMKEPVGSDKRRRLLQKAAQRATELAHDQYGLLRSQTLLALSNIRREQGMIREAVEAAAAAVNEWPTGLDAHLCLGRMLHESKQDVRAIGALTHVERVPLHELSAAGRRVQLEACELLLKLLAQTDPNRESVARRAELLRTNVV